MEFQRLEIGCTLGSLPDPPGPVGSANSHQRLKERPCRRSPLKQRSGGATAADCAAVMRPTTRVSGSRLHCLALTAKRRCRPCTCSPLPRIFCAFRKVRSLRQGQTCRARVLLAAVTGLHSKRGCFIRPDARLAAAADGKPTCVPQRAGGRGEIEVQAGSRPVRVRVALQRLNSRIPLTVPLI